MKTVTIRFKSEFAKAPESAAVTESKREALINLAHALEVQRLPVMPLQQAKVKSVQSGDTLVLVSVNNPRQERILSLAYTTGPRMRKEGDEVSSGLYSLPIYRIWRFDKALSFHSSAVFG